MSLWNSMSFHEIIPIVRAKLQANGYDGLFHPDGPCGCQCSELAPCGEARRGGEYINGCTPGYQHFDPRPEHAKAGDWAIFRQKETPTDEQWDQIDYG